MRLVMIQTNYLKSIKVTGKISGKNNVRKVEAVAICIESKLPWLKSHKYIDFNMIASINL